MDYSKTWLYHQTDNRDHLFDAKKRLQFVIKEIKKLVGIKKVIDLGFGDGYLLKELASNKIDSYGIDFVEKNIEITRQATGLGENLQYGSVTNIPFSDNMFDLAISTEMFEHLTEEDLTKALGEIHRVLKKNGFLIVTVPYNENLAKKMACCPNCGCKFHLWGHQQFFNEHNITEKFTEKFSIIRAKKLFPMTSNLNIFGKIEHLAKIIFKKYKGYYILLQAK